MNVAFSRSTGRYVALASLSLACSLPGVLSASPALPSLEVPLTDGMIEGTRMRKDSTDLRVFRGIPYAAPPVGEFRWREPQPVARWAGVRSAAEFGPRCTQNPDSQHHFRSTRMSEDCLFLNVWTPARGEGEGKGEKLPVLVYFHGGGFNSGDGSERRYDGAGLAARGIVAVTVNYRLGLFGFLASPEAASESPHGAAGNYGLLDQVAALRWVRDNIAQFGGDPDQVTIGGELEGAISVSAHMASPLSRGLFARAIGLSGGAFTPMGLLSRTKAQELSQRIMEDTSLAEMRTMDADAMQDEIGDVTTTLRLGPSVDGYFLPSMPVTSFSTGRQARVPLFVGTNAREQELEASLHGMDLTPDGWRKSLSILLGSLAEEGLTYFPGSTEEEVTRSAKRLTKDMFDEHSTWRWMDLQRQTGDAPVYFYEYTHPLALEASVTGESSPSRFDGLHGTEIEYALGNLDNETHYAWTADDREVSRIFSGYLTQFLKTGNPNGSGLPEWPAVSQQNDGLTRQIIAKQPRTVIDHSAAEQAFMLRFYDRMSPPEDS
jgi:para-nitrobenzyl esterase